MPEDHASAAGAGGFSTRLYEEMRGIAGRLLGSGRLDVLQPTAVVHEAYMKLARGMSATVGDTHFLAVAAKAVRQVVIDHARHVGREKRGGGARRLSLDTSLLVERTRSTDALEVEEALRGLEAQDARAATVVEMRFYGGMTTGQVAEHLGVSTATIERDWKFARAWLYRTLSERNSGSRSGDGNGGAGD